MSTIDDAWEVVPILPDHNEGTSNSSRSKNVVVSTESTMNWMVGNTSVKVPEVTADEKKSAGPPKHVSFMDGGSTADSAVEPDERIKRLKEENEALREQVASCQSEIDALKVELREREWAAQRAVELGTALGEATETAGLAQGENEKLKSRMSELDRLNAVQLELLVQLDSASADPTSSQEGVIEALSRRLQRQKQVHLQPAGCLRCMEHEEEQARNEIMLTEGTAYFQFDCKAEQLRRTQRYLAEQCTEAEIECMWREDMLAHKLQLQALQDEIQDIETLRKEHAEARAEAIHWKSQHDLLNESTKAEKQTMVAAHREDVERTRITYLRANPSGAVLRHLFLGCVKTHYAHGKVMFTAGVLRKHLLLLRTQLAVLKRTFKKEVKALNDDVQRALRRCLPVVWSPVLMAPDKKPVSARSSSARRSRPDGHSDLAAIPAAGRPPSVGRKRY